MGWEVILPALFRLGASWLATRKVMESAGMDDSEIDRLSPLWDTLQKDVDRAAGKVPPPQSKD